MKRALTTIVVTITGMFLAGSTWAAGYGTGVDEKTKEIGGSSTYQQKSWMDIKKEQIQEDIQKQEQQIEQKGEEPTKEMQEKRKEMMPSDMDDMMKNK